MNCVIKCIHLKEKKHVIINIIKTNILKRIIFQDFCKELYMTICLLNVLWLSLGAGWVLQTGEQYRLAFWFSSDRSVHRTGQLSGQIPGELRSIVKRQEKPWSVMSTLLIKGFKGSLNTAHRITHNLLSFPVYRIHVRLTLWPKYKQNWMKPK